MPSSILQFGRVYIVKSDHLVDAAAAEGRDRLINITPYLSILWAIGAAMVNLAILRAGLLLFVDDARPLANFPGLLAVILSMLTMPGTWGWMAFLVGTQGGRRSLAFASFCGVCTWGTWWGVATILASFPALGAFGV